MNENTVVRDSFAVRAVSVLIVLEAATFLVAALLHTGVPVPLGLAVLEEPVIVPATIVEGLCGFFLAIGAYAIFTHRSWAWTAAFSAHVFSVLGVLLGIFALSVGAGPRTDLNDVYHRVVLVALLVGLGLLSTPSARTALGNGESTSAPR